MDQEKLVAALKGRDTGAIQELVETQGDRLLRSAYLLCGNETDAADIVQDTLLEAIQSLHRFRGRSSLYTWLHSILLNLTRHYRRDRGRVIYDDELVRHETAPADDQPSRLDVESASTALTDALRRLSAPHREVLILRYYEQMKIHELARHLGISKGTVKSRLHYAIQEMQRLLPEELNLFGAGGTKETEKQ